MKLQRRNEEKEESLRNSAMKTVKNFNQSNIVK